MIGMVLIAHARMASEAKRAVEHVLGEQSLFVAVDVEDSDDIDTAMETFTRALRQCDAGDGVLVFADMFGGTPCNIAQSGAAIGRCEVISGFNLPSLIKAASERSKEKDLHALASMSIEAGRQYMRTSSEFIQKTATHA